MMKSWSKIELFRLVSVLLALIIPSAGLSFAGKPSGGGNQATQATSLSTVIDSLEGSCGLCPDDLGMYVDGKYGVRSLLLKDGGYQFTSDYSRSKKLRVVSINLQSPFPQQLLVPIHLAVQWNIRDLTQPQDGGMGGSFTYQGIEYRLRWGTADPIGGASTVQVTKMGAEWVIQSVPPHQVRMVVYDQWAGIIDKGLHTLPFKLTLTDLSASTQQSATPEDIFTWSPRGDRIALGASDRDGDRTIQVIDLQTSSVLGEHGKGVFTSAARGLAWANQGEMLAFSANNPDGVETVFVLNVRTGSLWEIGGGSAPRWSPDDSRLIFISPEGVSIFDLRRGGLVTVPRNGLD